MVDKYICPICYQDDFLLVTAMVINNDKMKIGLKVCNECRKELMKIKRKLLEEGK